MYLNKVMKKTLNKMSKDHTNVVEMHFDICPNHAMVHGIYISLNSKIQRRKRRVGWLREKIKDKNEE